MTTVNGSFTQCNNQEIFLSFSCTGPSCYALSAFPNSTCTNNTQSGDTQTMLTCTSGTECPGAFWLNSKFSYHQSESNAVVSQYYHNTLQNQEWIAQTDGTTNFTLTTINSTTNSTQTNNASRPGNIWRYFLWALLAFASLTPSVYASTLEIEPGLADGLKDFLKEYTIKFLGNEVTAAIEGGSTHDLVTQLEVAVCETLAGIVATPEPLKIATGACYLVLLGITSPIPPLELAAKIWAGVTCDLIISQIFTDAQKVDEATTKFCDGVVGILNEPPASSSPSSPTSSSSSSSPSPSSSSSQTGPVGSSLPFAGFASSQCASCAVAISAGSIGVPTQWPAWELAEVACSTEFEPDLGEECSTFCGDICQYYNITPFLQSATITTTICDTGCGDYDYYGQTSYYDGLCTTMTLQEQACGDFQ
jgi:hypothetical protein